jgi:opacity protein-like surface antigen
MKRLISIAMLAVLLSSLAFTQDETAKKKDAQTAAESWLALVDAGNYGQSWEEASSFFKSKVSRADWEKMLEQVRTPLGKSDSRTLAGAVYQTSLPKAPDGEYVVLQFKTNFANTGAAIETITPMLDKDGKWRVSGYFIKPVGM